MLNRIKPVEELYLIDFVGFVPTEIIIIENNKTFSVKEKFMK
jgi:hypothetical protein